MAAEEWTVEEAGAKGGRATLAKCGRGHYVEAGRKGGSAPKAKTGRGILFALAVTPEQMAWLEAHGKPQSVLRDLLSAAMRQERK